MLRAADNAYFPSAAWNFAAQATSERADSPMVRFLAARQWIVNLAEFARRPAHYPDLELADWLTGRASGWLVVPLVHGDVLRAFLVLDAARAARELNWEDYDLLKTVGRQAASYLAEEEAADALVDARQLEAFNRRFAFVVHDIKNLAGQLSLMLKNAERHGDNPAFQSDMLATVANSVARMKGLLEQLHAEKARPDAPPPAAPPAAVGRLAIAPLLERVAADWRRQKDDLEVDLGGVQATEVAGDEGRLVSVLNHLLQNAVDAAGAGGAVRLRLRCDGDEAVVQVEDDGPGMAPAFIQNQLFRPLESTKSSGYGLGAYQTRELVREMGGRLEVISAPGAGTVMRIALPVADDDRHGSGDEGVGL